MSRPPAYRSPYPARIILFVFTVMLVGAFGVDLEAGEAASDSNILPAPAGYPNFVDLAKRLKPAVVNIRTEKIVKGDDQLSQFYFGPRREPSPWGDPQEPSPWDFFDRFFQAPPGQEHKERSLGSGFVLSSDGYILTNNHVVEDANKIKVILSDGRELDGQVLGKDAKVDIALIKVATTESLPTATLGDSDALEVGEWVMAIGNPFGLDHTVTIGVVSAKGRYIGAGPYDDFIQTDASINPGNSGGPLINTRGEVVGINSAIIAQAQGIGFAIPINMVNEVLNQLKEKGRVIRGWLGVYVQKVTPELAESFGLKESQGALIGQVVEDGPAGKAGIQKGDIILKFGDREIKDMQELPRVVAATPVGKKVPVVLFRDGKQKTITVEVGELPEEKTVTYESKKENNLGMTVQELTPELASQLGYDAEKGVVVSHVEPGGPADEAGFRRGDLIKEANRKPITSMDDFLKVMDTVQPGDKVLLFVKRGDDTLYVVLNPEKAR